MLEDGQRYRGNQLKQGLDGGEVLGLDGENVQHLKRQGITSHGHGFVEGNELHRQEELGHMTRGNPIRLWNFSRLSDKEVKRGGKQHRYCLNMPDD